MQRSVHVSPLDSFVPFINTAIKTVFQLGYLGTSSFAAQALSRLPWLLTRSGTSTAAPANYLPNEQY